MEEMTARAKGGHIARGALLKRWSISYKWRVWTRQSWTLQKIRTSKLSKQIGHSFGSKINSTWELIGAELMLNNKLLRIKVRTTIELQKWEIQLRSMWWRWIFVSSYIVKTERCDCLKLVWLPQGVNGSNCEFVMCELTTWKMHMRRFTPQRWPMFFSNNKWFTDILTRIFKNKCIANYKWLFKLVFTRPFILTKIVVAKRRMWVNILARWLQFRV